MEKAFWQAIKQDSFQVPPGHTPAALAAELMTALGSTDPELRDELAYEILGTWVIRGLFAPDQLLALAEQLMINLEHGVGEQERDSVFLRTFSVLILVQVVAYDGRERVLPEADLRRILEAGLAYLAAEQDLRGYVAEKGWAHSVAHTADLLRALAAHPSLGASDLERILQAIAEKVAAHTPYPYIADEEDRLTVAVLAVLQRGLVAQASLATWLQGIAGRYPWREMKLAGHLETYHNTKALLTSLHSLLAVREPGSPVLPELVEALRVMTPWFYRIRP